MGMFSSEEQEIPSEVKPIVQSLRRIICHTGYKDGDPFPTKKPILESNKISARIDHIMVNGHSNFTKGCGFYVALPKMEKGNPFDIKCFQNHIKYPGQAETFKAK